MNEEEEYFQQIESYFLQKRGNPLLLSPKEWSLIREWYEANIPSEVVLRAIDRAFERKEDDDASSLSLRYCKRLVKSEHKRFLKSLEGLQQPGDSQPDSKNIAEFLDRSAYFLAESAVSARKSGNLALADFLDEKKSQLTATILVPFQQQNLSDLQRVEHLLTTMEKEIEQFLLPTISGEQIERFKENAMRELKAFQDKIDLPVYQEMLRRSLIKSTRKLYSIPRLSLFYM